ncbi:adenosine receptor A1 [Polymixia lowei]
MEFTWLYSLCQCVLCVSVIVVSVRLCMAGGGGAAPSVHEGPRGSRPPPRGGGGGSVSSCLRLCLGWVGAVGGAVGVPVSVLLNLRSPQCLYTCITLVCCPLLVRQFTMCLLLLLTLDAHLRSRLTDRYSSYVTRRRALCVVLLCWVCSVLSSFAQFFASDVLHGWGGGGGAGQDGGSAGLGLEGNWTSSSPPPPPQPKYPQDLLVIGKHLPYGGFLSKFYVEDLRNFTYAEIHGGHWGVCTPHTVLSPGFLVYVYGVTVFLLPLLGLLAIYLNLLCAKPRPSPFGPAESPKRDSSQARSLALSLSLLVLLCLPLHISHALLLFAPGAEPPIWAYPVAAFLSQLYSLVPALLFTPTKKRAGGQRASFPLAVAHLPPAVAPSSSSAGKAVGRVLCEAVQGASWCSAKLSQKVSPGGLTSITVK